MIKVLIIEDEEIAAERLSALLLRYDSAIEILDVIDSVKNAVNWLQSHPNPDLILLDIHLGDGLSFQIFEQVQVVSPIIFTTAFNEFAIKAFKLNSIDYLLKPIKFEELEAALEKFKSWSKINDQKPIDFTELIQMMQKKEPEYKTRFSIVIGQKIKLINTADVAYFYAESNIVYLVTKANHQYPVDFTLEQLNQQLDPKEFYRVNRQYLVKLNAIDNVLIYPKSRLKLILSPACKDEVFVSIEKSVRFKEWLDGR